MYLCDGGEVGPQWEAQHGTEGVEGAGQREEALEPQQGQRGAGLHTRGPLAVTRRRT